MLRGFFHLWPFIVLKKFFWSLVWDDVFFFKYAEWGIKTYVFFHWFQKFTLDLEKVAQSKI